MRGARGARSGTAEAGVGRSRRVPAGTRIYAATMTSATEFELQHDLGAVRILRCGAAAKIELNRPESMNAWNADLGRQLRDTVQDFAVDPGVRAVLITGAGRGFSSGADLREDRDRSFGGVQNRLTDLYHPIITGVRRMPKPVVAAVNGPAAGIGCSLALACDLVVAAESAYFLQAFVNIGLIPDGGSTLLVPARVGFARAAEMAMLGERISARQAVDWGLINRAWPDDEFAAQADELVARLADGPTKAYSGIKRELNRWLYDRMDDQLEFEAHLQQEMGGSADFAEGVLAFTERRPARFPGR